MKSHNSIERVFITLLLCAAACLSAVHQGIAGPANQLTTAVDSVAVAPKFAVYVGGGANISPPAPIGGGGGIPLISMSNGAAFMAGEVSSPDKNMKLLRITFTVRDTGHDATSFKIGDVGLAVGSEKWNDFMAVGYGTQLCAMGNEDRKKVREIVVTLRPGQARQLSVLFPLPSADAKEGELLLGSAPPASFQIRGR